jgi:hypothetical protein
VGGEGGGNESTRSAPLGSVVMTAEVQEARLDKSAGAGRMGKAAEHLVAAACVLSTRGELNVSTSMVDDEGVDLSRAGHRLEADQLAPAVMTRLQTLEATGE